MTTRARTTVTRDASILLGMKQRTTTSDVFGIRVNQPLEIVNSDPTLHNIHATPIAGLFLAGPGTHPGGGPTGLPGRCAARRLLADAGLRGRTPSH